MKRFPSVWLALALLGLSCASPRHPAAAPSSGGGGGSTSREGTTTTTTTQLLPDGRVLTTVTTTTITDPNAVPTGVRVPRAERADDERAAGPAEVAPVRRGPRRMDRFAATLPTTLPTTRPGILARTLPSGIEPFDRRLRRVQGQLEVHFIDVGQGDCTLVKCPDGRRLLIDCGTLGNSSYQPVREYLLQHLDPSEPRVDVLVITHTDSDHYKLLRDVLANVEVGRVFAVDEPDEHHVDGIDEWLGYFAEDQYRILRFDDHVDATAEVLEDFGDVEVLVMAANVTARSSPSNARASCSR
jgi:glyoxylase-like metal-dependent hydrolase (beta-lactamase superfamily II)